MECTGKVGCSFVCETQSHQLLVPANLKFDFTFILPQKRKKTQVNQYLFALLGSAIVKAARKMLLKLTQVEDVIPSNECAKKL